MTWIEICIHTTHDASEPITNILTEMGINGVLIEDPLDLIQKETSLFGEIYELDPTKYPEDGIYLKVYVAKEDSLMERINEIKERIDSLTDIGIALGKNTITYKEIEEQDWETSWKKYYKPTKISERITIVPTWEEYHPDEEELIIELDPGMAFGTGTHPTTMLSVNAIEQYIQPKATVIDVGSGSGILSIAAAALGARQVYAYDLDEVAVNSTKINVEINELSEKIEASANDLLVGINKKVDLIVSNILAEIIVTFAEDAWNNLRENGYFITSGIIQRKENLVVEELKAAGFTIIEIKEQDEWVCIIAQKNLN